MGDALELTAHLGSPLAGDAPHLDALLVYVASRLGGKNTEPGYKIDRSRPCPDSSLVPLPIVRERVGGFGVARASSPVLDEQGDDRHEYVAKRIAVEHAGLLAPAERKVVTTTNSWTKSYRLPLRVRTVPRVVWFAVGDRREVLKLLKHVPSIGKKIAHGYGRVARWECERLGDVPHRYWPWWWDSEGGPVLMRPLPAAWDGLPPDLVGAAPAYGACSDPYWHPSKSCELIEPC